MKITKSRSIDIDLTTLMIEKGKKASIKYQHAINLESFLSKKE